MSFIFSSSILHGKPIRPDNNRYATVLHYRTNTCTHTHTHWPSHIEIVGKIVRNWIEFNNWQQAKTTHICNSRRCSSVRHIRKSKTLTQTQCVARCFALKSGGGWRTVYGDVVVVSVGRQQRQHQQPSGRHSLTQNQPANSIRIYKTQHGKPVELNHSKCNEVSYDVRR